MARATWNGAVLAESEGVHLLEGNVYFPPASVNREFLRPSDTHTQCPWKGLASYYHVEVEGEVSPDAAWYYPDPSDAADHIKDHVAFGLGIAVEP